MEQVAQKLHPTSSIGIRRIRGDRNINRDQSSDTNGRVVSCCRHALCIIDTVIRIHQGLDLLNRIGLSVTDGRGCQH